jgi:chromosomal replication initiator protein
MRQDKLTTKFQQALADAQSLALSNDHAYIEAQHLLAAMLDDADSGIASLLARAGVNAPRLRQALAAALERLPKVQGTGGEVNVSRDLLNLLNLTDKAHKLSQDIEADPDDADLAKQARERAQQPAAQSVAPQQQEDIDTQLDPKLTFNNYMEGDSNKLPRSVGLSIAEHPNTTQFNPMFIYGPSGSGKTHLVNAIGLKAKQMYPQKRVLYVSARLFQTQYTDAVLHNASNDFINFYQSIDMLIVDDIQEWAGKAKTLNTFFHIFNHLFRNGKRIILACDRPPVELKDMPDRLLTRFSCGLVCELEKPNIQLCVDILSNKIRRDGLKIPVDVISFIAQTCNGSVRNC